MTMIYLRKQFLPVSALSTHLEAKWFFEFGQRSLGTRLLRTTGLVEIP